jgi:DNA-binding Xre family transcriptional regulator
VSDRAVVAHNAILLVQRDDDLDGCSMEGPDDHLVSTGSEQFLPHRIHCQEFSRRFSILGRQALRATLQHRGASHKEGNKRICKVNRRARVLIVVHLKEAIERYRARTVAQLTYQALSERTGIARATIESLATRPSYNTSLKTVAKDLDCTPGDLLELQKKESSPRLAERKACLV